MSSLPLWGRASVPAAHLDDAPLLLSLFNLDQLDAHARRCAASCQVSATRTDDLLVGRLRDNQRRLAVASSRLDLAQREGQRLSPGAEWMLDNQHLIEEQIRLARHHLPTGYSRTLPHLTHGPLAGYPRVYHLAIEVIAHVDGRVDAENLTRFVTAWQAVKPLTLGELWAIPIMLRLALIENLRRVSSRLVRAVDHREEAQRWAGLFLGATQEDPKSLLLIAADMARAEPTLSNAFVAELVQRLQARSGLIDIPLHWISHRLSELGSSVQSRVEAESSDQAANQVSVSSSIGSLRFLETVVWREFVEGASSVEALLRADPAACYAAMDFTTRDRYRHAVEDLARQARSEEGAVAALAISLAAGGAAGADGDLRATHVGHYLIGAGRPALMAALPGLSWRVRAAQRWGDRLWIAAYFAAMIGITTACAAALMAALPPLSLGWHLALWPVLLIATSQLGVFAANWLVTTHRAPRVLPRMDLSAAIPDASRTMVIVPTMLGSAAGIEALLEALEVRYLGNAADNLSFGLLTDLRDAATQHMPEDAALIGAAVLGVEALNERHGAGRFFLFHRGREWHAPDSRWMGYERKRGKLEALNHLLRGQDRRAGAAAPAFEVVVGDVAALGRVAFVITLDTDTGLPRNAGHKLIGAMSHPLNRPRFAVAGGCVTEGHAILQPRVAINLPSARRSWFVRLYGGAAGTDPYTHAVSDVYQDLFGQGSFVGKGIYDVDAFMRAVELRLPENLILSHDLIEGCFARSALVSDVTLYEDHPSHVLVDAARRRRWTRGDWQLLWWLSPWAPDRAGAWRINALGALSRWKLADNLRRSVVPLATLGATVAGLLWLKDPALVVAGALGVTFAPPLLSSLGGLLRRPGEGGLRAHVSAALHAAAKQLAQAAVGLAFMPEDARNNMDAIGRAGTRMLITRRLLLEWPGATDSGCVTVWSFFRAMGVGPLLAATVLAARLARGWAPLDLSLLLLTPWLLSPWVAAWLSVEREGQQAALDPAQRARLRRLARATWRYFDRFVGEEDHGLPPDNVQETPALTIAHRTSPTNIGLSLLSDLAAHDMGYLSTARLLDRTHRAVGAMHRMERFRGHLYNWYDTRTLEPLNPRYVSSVDSGNLMGHLMVMETGLRALALAPIVSPRAWEGMADTLDLVLEHAPAWSHALAPLRRALEAAPRTLDDLERGAADIEAALGALGALEPAADAEGAAWLDALRAQREDAVAAPLRDLGAWVALLPERTPNLDGWGRASAPPTLAALAASGEALGAEVVGEALWRAAGRRAGLAAAALIARAEALADEVAAQVDGMELDFLYDHRRGLFSIGYNVIDLRRDAGCYDLLASEARLLSYLAIARGDVPEAHWFALGRLVAPWRDEAALLSWSGSMFEYLMPMLVMPSEGGTLLEQTCRAVVSRQIAYGRELGRPWGVSESGYNLTDAQLNYQYKAFGVPGLGLKRGLGDDQVVAPYATVMALMVAPVAAMANLERLSAAGLEGSYGYYEAVDYTARRQALGEDHALIRSYMAHHQGMSMLSLAAVLLDQPMQRRFMSRPSLQATALLLHERPPRRSSFRSPLREAPARVAPAASAEVTLRVVSTPHTLRPEVQLLSNGSYMVMVSNAGGGFSRWRGVALTRWREDPIRDDWGSFLYIRDLSDDARWSATHQPTGAEADRYEAIFPQSRAEFRRRDHGTDLHTMIAVSPEDDVEVRRYTLTNLEAYEREIEITSYAEVVLGEQSADEAHPAFHKLFVQTEVLPERQAILCVRRPRGEEVVPVMLHAMAVYEGGEGALRYETDRRVFMGRGKTSAAPAGVMRGSQGSVLDPVVAIRARVKIGPQRSVSLHVVMGVAPGRDDALVLVDKYRDGHAADRVFELAWTHRQVMLRQLGITEVEAEVYQRMVSALVYVDPARRADAATLAQNRRGQSGLWAYGISGDQPIVLMRVGSIDAMEVVREVVRAHALWRWLGLGVELVLWDETETGYHEALREQVLAMLSTSGSAPYLDMPGGIFVRRREQFAEEDRVLLQTVARVLLTGGEPLLAQLNRRRREPDGMPWLNPTRSLMAAQAARVVDVTPGLVEGGRAYRIVTTAAAPTPAPWSNILANPHFGTLVTESGGGYTWCENSHEFRITPWGNDPVSDQPGESIYLRDEESGALWSPTPLPCAGEGAYEIHHRFGRSTFAHTSQGVQSEATVFVARDAPVKLTLLRIKNVSPQRRVLSVTGYCEWTLGEHRSRSLLTVTTEVDEQSGALLARNPLHPDFGARLAFFVSGGASRVTVTGDRAEFLGRNGHPARPAAMRRKRLSGRVGAGLDACGAIMAPLTLEPGESAEVVFVLGVGRSLQDVRTLVERFGGVSAAHAALEEVSAWWEEALGGVQVETPEPELDALVNGWLPYQVISSRLWGRTGLYQSGGAFGFRDQLQDAMGLMLSQPAMLREQIIRCAGRQFPDGDVQHWWHPPVGRGVRTHCSDDFLWLPAAVSRYVEAFGDTGVLEVRAHYLEGRQVKPHEEAYLDLPHRSESSATVYEHCVAAIERGLRFGERGLPLIGSGDWNDGMNLVGQRGRGESVWLGFFTFDVLERFAPVARGRGDEAFAARCIEHAASLRRQVEAHAWDGAWYGRAWFDDGTPLGVAARAECQIDAVPQSWAVLSGLATAERAQIAMEALDARLVDRGLGIIKLLAPPFDVEAPNPGYIRGYAPGVRENGGQYTHAAVWAAMAFARLGDWRRAWELTGMLSPASHTRDAAAREQYRVEPYVLAADIYAVAPHGGMGGWTWQTGSAAWMLRLVVESLLGLTLRVDQLTLNPCVPPSWPGFTLRYRHRRTRYVLRARPCGPGEAVGVASLDGAAALGGPLTLVDDGGEHVVVMCYAATV